jgi:hypothetical protein
MLILNKITHQSFLRNSRRGDTRSNLVVPPNLVMCPCSSLSGTTNITCTKSRRTQRAEATGAKRETWSRHKQVKLSRSETGEPIYRSCALRVR